MYKRYNEDIPEASVGHGQGGRACTILGLYNLITAELNTVHESIVLFIGDRNGRRCLAEEGDDGLARVTTDDGDVELLGLRLANNLSDEGFGADDVESGDTEQTLRVENILGLEDLGGNGNCRVDGVGDDEDERVGGNLGDDLNQALDNTSVDVEQVITSHTGLAYSAPVLVRHNIAFYEWSVIEGPVICACVELYVRGMPAGMTMMSASLKAALAPSLAGR